MRLLGKKIISGKGQIMITTRRRLFILSPGKMLIKVGAIGCAMVALIYSSCLGLKVRQSEAAAARIGAVTNIYMGKNSTQAERCRQVRLFANIIIDNSYSNSESAIAERRAFKVLRPPYPSIREVEIRLGAADERVLSSQSAHLTWNQNTWGKPHGWPSGNIDRAWPCIKNKVVEALFDSSGRVSQLIIFQQTEGDSGKVVEYIGRRPEDWQVVQIGDVPPFSPSQ
jgi:hypothetical protein